MEANVLRTRRETLQQSMKKLDDLLQTEDLSPIIKSYAEDVRKIGQEFLDASDIPYLSSGGQPFQANVLMSDMSNVLQSLTPAFNNLHLIVAQQTQVGRLDSLVAEQKKMLADMRDEREKTQQQMKTLLAKQDTLTMANFSLIDRLAKAEAWNMFYEIVHLYECSVWWRHTTGLKRSLNQAVGQHIVSEAELSKELAIPTDRVRTYLKQFQEVKKEREQYGHLAAHIKCLQRDGVKKIIDEYAGKHGSMLDKLHRYLVGADADITLQQIRDKINVLRQQRCDNVEDYDEEEDEDE